MRKSSGTKQLSEKNRDVISEVDRLTVQENPLIQDYITELKKEIARLVRVNAKQEVAHFSAMEKLKAELEAANRPTFTINPVSVEDGHPA